MMNFSDLGKMKEMMSQAKGFQEQLEHQLTSLTVEAEAGGGAVTVRMNGRKELISLKIDRTAVSDMEVLQDFIVAAVNLAGRRVDDAIKSNAQGILGGIKLPGLS